MSSPLSYQFSWSAHYFAFSQRIFLRLHFWDLRCISSVKIQLLCSHYFFDFWNQFQNIHNLLRISFETSFKKSSEIPNILKPVWKYSPFLSNFLKPVSKVSLPQSQLSNNPARTLTKLEKTAINLPLYSTFNTPGYSVYPGYLSLPLSSGL